MWFRLLLINKFWSKMKCAILCDNTPFPLDSLSGNLFFSLPSESSIVDHAASPDCKLFPLAMLDSLFSWEKTLSRSFCECVLIIDGRLRAVQHLRLRKQGP